MQNVLLTGGTGVVGTRLSSELISAGYSVTILTRSAKEQKSNGKVKYASWDVKKQQVDLQAIQSADYIIHLAGAGVVDHKWTNAYKKEIVESRTESSKLLVTALGNTTHKVKAIVSASAIGWYGEDKIPGHHFIESDPPDDGFLGNTCKLWEESITKAEALNIRVCKLRTGIVLDNNGGAFAEFRKPVKFGIASILGSGKQVISWIHIEDLCRLYIHALKENAMSGSFNAVSPSPVSNKEMILSIATRLRGRFFIPTHVPEFVLKIMLGARSIEVLKSATISAEKTQQSGFTFLYPSLPAALNELIK